MITVPIRYQKLDSNACAAACAVMVFHYYGVHSRVTYRTLTRELQITHEHGTSKLRMLRMFEKRGFDVTLRKFKATLVLRPSILIVTTEQLWGNMTAPGHHAVVLTGVKNGFVYLNDPYLKFGGRIRIGLSQLKKALATGANMIDLVKNK